MRLAERAAELTEHRDAAILDTLAAAYASAGRFVRAVEVATSALERTPASGGNQLPEIRARLEGYRRREAYRRPEHEARRGTP